jgi:hypothetical protein
MISIISSSAFYLLVKLAKWAGHIGRMGEKTGVYRVLVGKPEG